MSLFANENYRWRETYFVLFRRENRPSVDQLKKTLQGLGGGYDVSEIHLTEEGNLEALTLLSPLDFAAMDISYVEGEEVVEQIEELKGELETPSCSQGDSEKRELLLQCDARFDIYHFQQIVGGSFDDDDEDEYMDPGSLLQLLTCLTQLCQGVSIDPQSGQLM